MKSDFSPAECSFSKWYPKFSKNASKAVILPLPEEIIKYLEHDAFLLPLEAANDKSTVGTEWSDGSTVDANDEV